MSALSQRTCYWGALGVHFPIKCSFRGGTGITESGKKVYHILISAVYKAVDREFQFVCLVKLAEDPRHAHLYAEEARLLKKLTFHTIPIPRYI